MINSAKAIYILLSVIVLAGTVYSADTCTVKLTYRGVTILTYNEKSMFPDSWLEEPDSGHSLPLEKAHESRALEVIKKALDKYPEKMLKKNLKKVYLLGALEFYGLAYGGTYNDNRIYLCVKDSTMGYDSKYIEKAFHHEFSSMLINNYSFDEVKWEYANHSEFSYGDGGIEALRSGRTGLEFDVKFNRMGFLNEYSTASIEQDINEICGSLFISSARFWNLAETYGRIKKKINIAIEFYSSIDPAFTEEFFKGLAK